MYETLVRRFLTEHENINISNFTTVCTKRTKIVIELSTCANCKKKRETNQFKIKHSNLSKHNEYNNG